MIRISVGISNCRQWVNIIVAGRRLKGLYEKDISQGYGEVNMPEALDRKYPKASREFGWQWFFPMAKPSVDPRSGKVMRHHLIDRSFQRIVGDAIVKAGVNKHGSCHAFRHYVECWIMGSVLTH
jgi:integrase